MTLCRARISNPLSPLVRYLPGSRSQGDTAGDRLRQENDLLQTGGSRGGRPDRDCQAQGPEQHTSKNERPDRRQRLAAFSAREVPLRCQPLDRELKRALKGCLDFMPFSAVWCLSAAPTARRSAGPQTARPDRTLADKGVVEHRQPGLPRQGSNREPCSRLPGGIPCASIAGGLIGSAARPRFMGVSGHGGRANLQGDGPDSAQSGRADRLDPRPKGRIFSPRGGVSGTETVSADANTAAGRLPQSPIGNC